MAWYMHFSDGFLWAQTSPLSEIMRSWKYFPRESSLPTLTCKWASSIIIKHAIIFRKLFILYLIFVTQKVDVCKILVLLKRSDDPNQYARPVIDSILSLCRYLCWWTVSLRGYHLSCSQCFYHCVDTSAGGLLISEGIICPVVSVSITVSIPLLVDC
jgi:hypothetical protein